MKYKVEYKIKGDERIHRRYYSALNARTAQEMFKATWEETLYGSSILRKSIKIFHRLENGEWEVEKKSKKPIQVSGR